MVTAAEFTHPTRPGFLVRADSEAIAARFHELIRYQPLAWVPQGLLLAPLDGDDPSGLDGLTIEPAHAPAIWPDSPAALVAGWYRRTPAHAAAPDGVRELVQATGEGFGPHDHPTTAMCLEILDDLPPGDAIDAGCGSGLLAQAWVRLGHGRVLAIDMEPAAIRQTTASLESVPQRNRVEIRQAPVQAIAPHELTDRVLLANVPPAAHLALAARITSGSPRCAVISGLRSTESADVLDAYTARGMRRTSTITRGRFDCHLLDAA